MPLQQIHGALIFCINIRCETFISIIQVHSSLVKTYLRQRRSGGQNTEEKELSFGVILPPSQV